ncbi:MAG: sigma-54-dependent Fis family transcriptional regulator [Candidatus Krumholzibacteriota bacterium]|nr:sigma-54-dependent Fis family transcriptional regulator [Candidatus Krumholzibacteriota bacterium]
MLQIRPRAPERPSRRPGVEPSPGGISFDDIIGESPVIKAVIALGRELADADVPSILIQGETGTGKELFARALHNAAAGDGRPAEPFVEISSSAIPESLLEAELFGFERGAFTDAKRSKRGLLEIADGGTLFLDEIGSMSLSLQAKLLNVLEEKRFRRLGGTQEIAVGVKIVAATNTDLQAAIRDGFFREDLYYRLAVVSLELPPLRARERDVILLAEHFLRRYCAQHGRRPKRLGKRTEDLLLACSWPGNIRELRNTVQRAVLLSKSDVIKPQDVSLGVRSYVPLGGGDGRITLTFDPHDASLDEMERQIILKALALADWNKTRAAGMLKISRPRLLRRLKSLDVGGRPGGAPSPATKDAP